MAISSSALSLLEWANQSNSPLVSEITYSLRKAGSIMTDIPFVSKKTMLQNGVRFTGGLPTVDWVPVNTEATNVKSTAQPYQEQAYLFRNQIDIDKVLMEDQNAIVNPMGFQVEAFVRSAAYDFNDKFVNNNHATGDADAFVGIRTRLDNPTIYGSLSTNKIDATGATADMSPSLTASTFNKFMEKVEELLWNLNSPEGDGVVLYVNDTLQRRLATGARLSAGQGGFSQAVDQYGRAITKYKNAVIRDAGLKADQTTKIITSTEDAAGVNGSSTFTSMYGVRFGMDGLFGWQFEPMNAEFLGKINNGVIYRTVIDWTGGIMMPDIRAIGRLYDIKIS